MGKCICWKGVGYSIVESWRAILGKMGVFWLAHVSHVVKYNGPRHKSRWVENEQVLALIILGDSCIPELQFTMEIASVQLWVQLCSHIMQLLGKPMYLVAAKEGFWIAAKLRFGFLQRRVQTKCKPCNPSSAHPLHTSLHVCCSCAMLSLGLGWNPSTHRLHH